MAPSSPTSLGPMTARPAVGARHAAIAARAPRRSHGIAVQEDNDLSVGLTCAQVRGRAEPSIAIVFEHAQRGCRAIARNVSALPSPEALSTITTRIAPSSNALAAATAESSGVL